MTIKREGPLHINDILKEFQMEGQQFNLFDFFAGNGKIRPGQRRLATDAQAAKDGLAKNAQIPNQEQGPFHLAHFYGVTAWVDINSTPAKLDYTTGPDVPGVVSTSWNIFVGDDGAVYIDQIGNETTLLKRTRVGKFIGGFEVRVINTTGPQYDFYDQFRENEWVDVYALQHKRLEFGVKADENTSRQSTFTVMFRQKDYPSNAKTVSVTAKITSRYVRNGVSWSGASIPPFLGNTTGKTGPFFNSRVVKAQVAWESVGGKNQIFLYVRSATSGRLFNKIQLTFGTPVAIGAQVQLRHIGFAPSTDNPQNVTRWPSRHTPYEFGFRDISAMRSNGTTSCEFGTNAYRFQAWGGSQWQIKIRDKRSKRMIYDQTINIITRWF